MCQLSCIALILLAMMSNFWLKCSHNTFLTLDVILALVYVYTLADSCCCFAFLSKKLHPSCKIFLCNFWVRRIFVCRFELRPSTAWFRTKICFLLALSSPPPYLWLESVCFRNAFLQFSSFAKYFWVHILIVTHCLK